MLRLNNLKSPKGSHRNIKRIGRGQASGQGCQAGKGHKGQKARAGGGIALGFEGGQMPLYRRLPKKGFSNADFKKEYAIINLGDLENFQEDVSRESLLEAGIIKGHKKSLPIKVLAGSYDKLNKPLNFSGIEKFSKTALEVIQKAGGKVN